MKKCIILLFFFSLILTYNSCSDNSVDPDDGNGQVEAKIYQASKCLGGAYKTTSFDSSFTYDFSNDLNINILVLGNCCPDSNRFTSNYYISADTIYATVTDTAINGCDCTCDYIMHFEFTGLTGDKYVFNCEAPIFNYSEVVSR